MMDLEYHFNVSYNIMDLIRGCLLIAKVGGARPRGKVLTDKYVQYLLAGNYRI